MIQTNNTKPKQKRMMVTIDINAVIYGNKEKSDRIYTDYLKKFGIKTEYNNLPLDSNLKLPDQAPDAAVFIITKYNPNTANIISNFKNQYPDVKIIVLSANGSHSHKKTLLEAGTDVFVLLPMIPHNLYATLIKLFTNAKIYKFDYLVTWHLMSLKVTCTPSRFRYICSAVCIYLMNTAATATKSDKIAPALIKMYGITPKIVTHALDDTLNTMYKNGLQKNLVKCTEDPKRKLQAKEFITLLTTSFALKYNLYRDNLAEKRIK